MTSIDVKREQAEKEYLVVRNRNIKKEYFYINVLVLCFLLIPPVFKYKTLILAVLGILVITTTYNLISNHFTHKKYMLSDLKYTAGEKCYGTDVIQ